MSAVELLELGQALLAHRFYLGQGRSPFVALFRVDACVVGLVVASAELNLLREGGFGIELPSLFVLLA